MQSSPKELEQRGWMFLRTYRPDAPCAEVAASLGFAVESLDGSSVRTLRVHSREAAPPNTYGGIYGTSEIPFHTDLAHWSVPPRYAMLRCIRGDPNVYTEIVTSAHVVESVGKLALRRALAIPRRPFGGRRVLCRLYEDWDHGLFRWDRAFLTPATKDSSLVFAEVVDCLEMLRGDNFSLSSKGDTLIFDNWRVLHRRSEVSDPSKARELERAYLRVPH
jgi:hypothetical protein